MLEAQKRLAIPCRITIAISSALEIKTMMFGAKIVLLNIWVDGGMAHAINQILTVCMRIQFMARGSIGLRLQVTIHP